MTVETSIEPTADHSRAISTDADRSRTTTTDAGRSDGGE